MLGILLCYALALTGFLFPQASLEKKTPAITAGANSQQLFNLSVNS